MPNKSYKTVIAGKVPTTQACNISGLIRALLRAQEKRICADVHDLWSAPIKVAMATKLDQPMRESRTNHPKQPPSYQGEKKQQKHKLFSQHFSRTFLTRRRR